MNRSQNKNKEIDLLKESEDWEAGRRGSESVPVSSEDEERLDQKLGLHMISIRLPIKAVEELKQKAAEQGLGYQPYIRQIIMQHLQKPSIEERLERLERKMDQTG